MQNEERIMNWLVEQKMEDEIEEVSEDVLQELIESSDYLAVLICKLIRISFLLPLETWLSNIT